MRAVPQTPRVLLGAIFVLTLTHCAAMASPAFELQVLEQSADRTTFRVILPTQGERFARVQKFVLALPSSRAPRLEVLHRRDVYDESDQRGVELPGMEDLTQLGRPHRVRGVWRAVLSLSLLYRGQDGRPRRLQEIEITVNHPAAAGEFAPPPALGAFDPAVHFAAAPFVNPAAARSFRRASILRQSASAKVAGENDTFARSSHWLRLEISRTGLYRLRYEDLEALLQADAASIDPASLRLFSAPQLLQAIDPNKPGQSWESDYELKERAISVVASAPAAGMGAGDYILFYAGGIDTWMDRHDPSVDDPYAHVEHQYADHLALWLSWDEIGLSDSTFPASPQRMSQLDATPDPDPAQDLSDYRDRLHLEDSAAMRYGIVKDNWTMTSSPLRAGEGFTKNWTTDHVLADSTAYIFVNPVMIPASSVASIELLSNGTNAGNYTWSSALQLSGEIVRFGGAAMAPLDGGNQIQIVNRSTSVKIDLDLIDLSYRRGFFTRSGSLEWMVFPDEAATPVSRTMHLRDEEQASAGFDLESLVLNTTDPDHPVILTGAAVDQDSQGLRFKSVLQAGEHFAAYESAALLKVEAMKLGRPRLLRSEVFAQGGWDYLAVGPADLIAGADELVNYHSQVLRDPNGQLLPAPRVTDVDLQDIWDNFGYGVKEPAALRNFLKFCYLHPVRQEAGRQTQYALLVGDASRDYRSRLPGSTGEEERDRCPTFVQTHWPYSNETQAGQSQYAPYASDDWFGAFDAPDSSTSVFSSHLAPYDLPELGLGRMPVADLSEARLMVRRATEYQTAPEPGGWRNDVLLVCDDEVGLASGSVRETMHINEGEILAESLIPDVVDVTKLYLTEYPNPPGPRNKPAARAEMRRSWSDGKLIVHYIGHGSPRQLADEKVFLIEDVAALTNESRLPLFLAFSCDVSIFDSPTEKSMAEQLVLHEGGGAIASIAATQVTFVQSNDNLTNDFYPLLFPSDDPADSPPIGAVLRDAIVMLGGSAFTDHNSLKYALFGDPALSLATAKKGLVLTGALTDTIATGTLSQVVGRKTDGQLLSGRYELLAREARDHSGYSRVDNDTTIFHIPYVLDGAAFFKGQGTASGESLRVDLPVPVSLRAGSDGRVRMLYEDDGLESSELVGISDPVPVVLRSSSSDDTDGPTIQLSFSTASVIVVPGDTLSVRISDPSGINVLGTTPASRINVDFDSRGFPLDITRLFRLDEGRFDSGGLNYPLPSDLEPGAHTMQVSASDTRGNLSKASISFTLRQPGALEITDAVAVPNPFSRATRFVVDLSDAARVEIGIHSLDGRLIRKLEDVQNQRGVLVIDWDGLDFRGDEIANGAYLYTVRATFLQASQLSLTKTGRVVRMR